MKAYVMTTGAVFGLLALIHLWRFVEEGTHLMTDPWFIATTLIAASLCAWAVRLLRFAARS